MSAVVTFRAFMLSLAVMCLIACSVGSAAPPEAINAAVDAQFAQIKSVTIKMDMAKHEWPVMQLLSTNTPPPPQTAVSDTPRLIKTIVMLHDPEKIEKDGVPLGQAYRKEFQALVDLAEM